MAVGCGKVTDSSPTNVEHLIPRKCTYLQLKPNLSPGYSEICCAWSPLEPWKLLTLLKNVHLQKVIRSPRFKEHEEVKGLSWRNPKSFASLVSLTPLARAELLIISYQE